VRRRTDAHASGGRPAGGRRRRVAPPSRPGQADDTMNVPLIGGIPRSSRQAIERPRGPRARATAPASDRCPGPTREPARRRCARRGPARRGGRRPARAAAQRRRVWRGPRARAAVSRRARGRCARRPGVEPERRHREPTRWGRARARRRVARGRRRSRARARAPAARSPTILSAAPRRPPGLPERGRR